MNINQVVENGMKTDDTHFLVGVVIHRPKVDQILGVNLSTLSFSSECPDPQLIFGFTNNQYSLRLETYYNDDVQIQVSIPATIQDTINIFRGLANKYRVIDVHENKVRV